MDLGNAAALAGALGLTGVHILSAGVAAWRQRPKPQIPYKSDALSLAIIRPLRGLDASSEACLQSTFQLGQDGIEIIFCVESIDDPVIPLVQRIMELNRGTDSKLLIGNDRISDNPKLNNLVKAWRATRADWIVFVDANVLLPPDAIARLMAKDGPGVGLISSPPNGSAPEGLEALVECAVLNSYQARWQSFADAIGYGFAQGKVLAFRRELIERAGGMSSLATEPAEDAAATKLVRNSGLQVRLVDRFFDQPVGVRTWQEIWLRQARWASLRRASFPLQFAAEIFSYPWLAAALAAFAFGTAIEQTLAALAVLILWYGAETICGKIIGWPERTSHRILRDLLLPAAWLSGWLRTRFEWHGHKISAERATTTSAA